MVDERPRNRPTIVATLAATSITATIYDAGRNYSTDHQARSACLAALVKDLTGRGSTRLVIEQDDSLVRSDRHELYRLTRAAGITDVVDYGHQRAHDEPLLALPDVAAWCWVRSSDWRRHIEPMLTSVRHIGP